MALNNIPTTLSAEYRELQAKLVSLGVKKAESHNKFKAKVLVYLVVKLLVLAITRGRSSSSTSMSMFQGTDNNYMKWVGMGFNILLDARMMVQIISSYTSYAWLALSMDLIKDGMKMIQILIHPHDDDGHHQNQSQLTRWNIFMTWFGWIAKLFFYLLGALLLLILLAIFNAITISSIYF